MAAAELQLCNIGVLPLPRRRAERILCLAIDEEDEPSKPTCACWVGGRANCFAVGYGDGSILLWGVPPAAIKGAHRAQLWGGGPSLHAAGDPARPDLALPLASPPHALQATRSKWWSRRMRSCS